ncbi:MAG: cytidylate kinase-like family protein [Deltaproteobacteria bacterium]|nr:cytidylate kinase-like family protein [Deltaproteobacteria bacterium]
MIRRGPGHLDHLIDRHVALLDVQKRVQSEKAGERAAQAAPEEGHWLTVSMGMGVQGEAIGRAVGERLGWRVFDRELLDVIARTEHTRERLLARLDERAVGKLEEFFSRFLMPREPSRSILVNDLMQVIWALGREGSVVLLGRGANFVLAGTGGLRVRLVATLEERVARVAEEEKLSSAEAKAKILADDTRREGFLRQTYGRAINDPRAYDLILNTGTLGVERSVELILTALGEEEV